MSKFLKTLALVSFILSIILDVVGVNFPVNLIATGLAFWVGSELV